MNEDMNMVFIEDKPCKTYTSTTTYASTDGSASPMVFSLLTPIKKKSHFSGFFNMFDRDKQKEIYAYIKKVVYSNPATIVMWSDDTKTVAKCNNEDEYSPETGLAICVLKKLIGGVQVRNLFEDWIIYEDGVVETRDVRKKHKDE